MSDWQPIATAPKDGRPIMVARNMGEFGWIVGWSSWADIRGISGWISRGFYEPFGNLGLGSPTHWQPIPEPPK